MLKNIINYLSYAPKQMMFAIAAAGLVILPMTAGASWSPERETFTIDAPADYVTFNSITDNPNYGDERTFFDAKPASNTSSGGFVDNVAVGDLEDGDELLLRMYVHNNAKESLNEPDYTGEGVAENTRVEVMLPEATKRSLRAIGYIHADNATPGTVSDTVDFQSTDRPFNLEFVEDSAVIHTNAHPEGMQLGNDIVNEGGTQIGYDEINGRVPGCFQYTGIVTFKVKVNKADVAITKQVRHVGDSDWSTEIHARPGDEVEYLIEFENTGSTRLDNVAVGDNLPQYVSYVEGSTQYANASTNFEPTDLGSDNITTGGVDLGNYEPGANAFVMFEAKIDPINVFEKNGDYTLRNVGIVRPFADTEQMNQFINTADIIVTVEGKAQPEQPEKPEKPEQPEQPEKPDEEFPDELADTGLGGIFGGLFGSAGLGIAFRNWFSSRRKLLATMLES